MNRRGFLGALLASAIVWIVSQLPWSRVRYGAVFRVTSVDPDGSGMDYAGHLGRHVYNVKRCCRNCTVLFGAWSPGGDVHNGPGFNHGELTPINAAARSLMAVVMARHSTMASGVTSFGLAS